MRNPLRFSATEGRRVTRLIWPIYHALRMTPYALPFCINFMNNILDKIIEQKKHELEQKKFYFPLTKFIKNLKPSERSFKTALQTGDYLHIIAEIKKASPSEGLICPDFDPVKIAKIYEKHADAISVVTDEKFFQGKLEYLEKISAFSKVPLLRKDFIIDEYQIYESRLNGADAILLIANVLTLDQLISFMKIARHYDMDCLVEVHTLEELREVLRVPVEIIGINNRNLQTFDIDITTTAKLAPHIPEGKIIVSESGIKTRKDLEILKADAMAILIGTHLMKSKNMADRLKKWKEACRVPVKKDQGQGRQLMIV